jgi:hypothetical protein
MRIVEPTLNMFIGELKKGTELEFQVVELAEKYLKYKKNSMYGPNDWYTKDARAKLERSLMRYKLQMSKIYDLMHDRGLVNFESSFRPDGNSAYYLREGSEGEGDEESATESEASLRTPSGLIVLVSSEESSDNGDHRQEEVPTEVPEESIPSWNQPFTGR